MTAAVGADVESLCSKCGDVWHVVVAKLGERIAKVQCKQCHGFHRYKPPPGKEPAKAARPTKAARAAGVVGAAGAKVKATKPRAKRATAPAPPAVQPDMSRPIRRYSPGENYTPGDRINHPTFGAGVVESTPGSGKIQVVFPEGRRVLAVAKVEGTLGKPTNSPHG